ncbi:MAG: hypothetical protein MUQ00_09485 [Candidatus Aminicenantes bacterium]|nr:hypothetical protein [Candidatus Aminicenantes bacterium]
MNVMFQKILGVKEPDHLTIGVFEDLGADDKNRKALEEKIGQLTDRAKDFSSSEILWSQLLALVEKARTAADNKNWSAAWQAVTEAIVRLNRAIESEALRPARLRLLLVPAFWCLVLYFFQVVIGRIQIKYDFLDFFRMEFFRYVWFGLLGGTTIFLWGIVKHSSEMNFDGSFLIWYLLKPPLGAIMGSVVVLMTMGGFLALNNGQSPTSRTPLLILAFIGGFSERFFLRLVDRVISSVFEGGKDGASSQLEIGVGSPSSPPPGRPNKNKPK